MRFELNNKWRCLHSISGLFYVIPVFLLYNKNNCIGYCLYTVCAILSFLWSYTSRGGVNGTISKLDEYVAYICVIYNYYFFLQLSTPEKYNKIPGFIFCHLAGIIYFLKEYLIKHNYNVVISYGILHFIWRTISSIGVILLYL